MAAAARPHEDALTAEAAAQAQHMFPAADEIRALPGSPPLWVLRQAGHAVGYAFLSHEVVAIPAYSGKPISVLVAFDTMGRIRGAKLMRHAEPILVIGIGQQDLQRFVGQYIGKKVSDRIKLGGRQRPGYVTLDGISGATITAIVINASIMRALHKVAAAHGLPLNAAATPAGPPAVRDAAAEPAQGPLWRASWQARWLEIVALVTGLTVLTLMLLMQDWLAKRPALLAAVRYGFLSFTLVYLGIYAMAQLSVLNVLTFLSAAMHEFRWEAFLIDPVLFILWAFVAVTLLLWGRGVYCGWLCPFGALQELLHRLAKGLRVPQLEFPEVVHDRLWAAKYVIFIVLFGLSLQSLHAALPYAEIEPFKTVFALHMQREWPYVVYALVLLAVALFNHKFFCKYLCPLGAALAIPAKLRLFDWLRRRKECGRPCQACAEECEVRAIRATGEINHHECHYCLDCQITYYNDHKCPPLVERRKRLARLQVRIEKPEAGTSQVP